MSGTIGNTKKLVTSAMLIAVGTVISFVCEFIPFLNLPFGGTITIASTLPVVLISYMYGLSWGFGSALVFALMQMVGNGGQHLTSGCGQRFHFAQTDD